MLNDINIVGVKLSSAAYLIKQYKPWVQFWAVYIIMYDYVWMQLFTREDS